MKMLELYIIWRMFSGSENKKTILGYAGMNEDVS